MMHETSTSAAAVSARQPHHGGAIFLRLLAYPLFLASGAAGLIYEVVWNRVLLDTFGSGLYAVTAVVAAFMAGLALGAWLLGSLGDRMGRPLRLYGALELGVALCGLAAPFVLHRVALIDQPAYRVFGQNFAALTAVRFAVAFGLLMIPTTLMGATLPVMARFMIRQRDHLGLHVGGLYATNTFGAVVGTFSAGFFLIAWLGLQNTDFFAASLNTIIGLCALLLSLAIERQPMPTLKVPAVAEKAEAGAPSLDVVRWVLMTALISGVVALAAQILWSRALIFSFVHLKNTTYAFTAMLTVFLAGLALGSALVGLFVDSQKNPLRLYGMLLTLLGISMMLSIVILYRHAEGMLLGNELDAIGQHINWPLAIANVMMQSLGVLGIPTLLMGMAFPVAARVVTQMGRVGTDVGRLYALNTIGSILGSLLAAFAIIPTLGLTGGLIMLGLVDTAIGLATMWRAGQARTHMIVLGPIALAMAGFAGFLTISTGGLQKFETKLDTMPFYMEGPLATVSVVKNNIDESTIFVDAVGVAGTDPILQTDQKSLAHVPMMLLENPKAALTVGFGSGGCSYSLNLHDALKKVHCVEICNTVLRASPYLGKANHLFFARTLPTDLIRPGMMLAQTAVKRDGSTLYKASTILSEGQLDTLKKDGGEPGYMIGDPLEFSGLSEKYHVILDDARAYLRYTNEKYDFIATDCTDLRYKSNANLYDLEYFQACRGALTPEGIVVVWMPLGGLDPEIFRTCLRTFYRVFPDMGIFYMDNEPTHYILMIGWQKPFQLDYRLFTKRLAEADVLQDLAELYLDDPVKLLSCFITGGRDAFKEYLAGDELNTENNPVIEFKSPRYGYSSKSIIDNLAALMKIRVSPQKFLVPGSMPPGDLERLTRYEAALPQVLQGHAALREMDIEGATEAYMAARKITPEDLSVKNQLTFPIMQKRLEKDPNDPLVLMWFGRSLMMQGNIESAYRLLDRSRGIYENIQKGFQAGAAKSKNHGPSQMEPVDLGRLELVKQWLAELEKQRKE
ncbi:fused MFS/spermidine synthase [bacterium]|nr:fused MFS/spermidine synthase [bacterium]